MRRAFRLGNILRVLAAAVLLLTACRSEERPTPVVVELVDISGSVGDAPSKERLLDQSMLVAEATARRRGSFVVELIDAVPTADSTAPVAHEFRPSRHANNRLYADAEIARQLREVRGQLEAVLARPTQAGTDVIAALSVAERHLARAKAQGRPTELVLASDMMQSVTYDFYRLELSAPERERILGELKADGRIPNLGGTAVYVTGATVDPTGQVSALEARAVEDFWRAFFAAAGAPLEPGRYASRFTAYP